VPGFVSTYITTKKMVDDGPAALLHVHARDSNGTSVSLQIFTACFTDLNDSVGHLLGILELSREEYGVPDGTDPSNQSLDFMKQWRSNESAMRSSSSASHSLLPLALPEASLEEVTIWFDATTLSVLRTTPACTTIAGPSCEGTDLTDWMVNPKVFIDQVQALCKPIVKLYDKRRSSTPLVQLQRVKLQPPIAMRAHIGYVADVSLSMDCEDSMSSESHDFLIMRAAFTNISQRRSKKRHEARGRVRQSLASEPGIDRQEANGSRMVTL